MNRPWKESGRVHPALVIALALLAGGLVFTLLRFEPQRSDRGEQAAGYIDPELCADCHADIAETYRETGMGRSFSRAAEGGENFEDSAFYHEPSRQYFRTYWKNGKLYQRRHMLGLNGQETNVIEKEVHFVLGSGNHSRTYIHRTEDGRLLQLPAAWYSEGGGKWAMNPGFDQPKHYGFRRFLSQDCFFCHNAYPPNPLRAGRRGADLRVGDPMPMGIDCQRCHGPGAAHVAAAAAGPAEKIRASIVNPGRLESRRQLETCLQCHLESTSRRLPYSLTKFDRNAFSFVPGEPLADFAVHFDFAEGKGPEDHFEIAHHGYRLMQSACYRESEGKLTCTTCHDPHRAVRGQEAAEKFSAACRNCHSADVLEALAKSGKHPRETSECVSCHMPQRRTDDVVHVVMTDHRIQKRPPKRNLLAPLKEVIDTAETAYRGPVVVLYPPDLEASPQNELYLAAAQVAEGANLEAGATRLEAALQRTRPDEAEFYHLMAEAWWQLGEIEKAIPWYRQALDHDPNFLPSARNLGVALSRSGQVKEAREFLEQARQKFPDDAAIWNNLGEACLLAEELGCAAQALQTALQLDPELPDALTNMAKADQRQGQMNGAEARLREAIRVAPDFAVAHNNLGNLLSAQGRTSEAAYHLEESLRLQPEVATTHLNYGLALAAQQKLTEAERAFRKAIELDGQLAEAHTSLGSMLAMKGDPAGAEKAFRRAIETDPGAATAWYNYGVLLASHNRFQEAEEKLQAALQADPQHPEAHLTLAQLSLQQNKAEAALPHLRAAAAGTNQRVREIAVQILEALGKR